MSKQHKHKLNDIVTIKLPHCHDHHNQIGDKMRITARIEDLTGFYYKAENRTRFNPASFICDKDL